MRWQQARAAVAAAAFMLAVQPALAQSPPSTEQAPAESMPALPQPEGTADEMVNVDLRNVASRIADNLKKDVSQIPLSVMAPARVAANVCSMEQALMAQRAAGGGMECTADHTTSALDAIVDEQMKK